LRDSATASTHWKKPHRVRGGQAIEDLGTAFFVRENAGILELAQVLRDSGHLGPDQLGQLPHVQLAARQFIHEEKTGGMGQSFEHLGLRTETWPAYRRS